MSSPIHGHDLRPRIKSRIDKRVKDMVAANGGPEKCLGKPSATGLGVHLIFLSEGSPRPTTSPGPGPRARPSTGPREEQDVKMVDSSESSSGSDTDTAEHTPNREHIIPSRILNAPTALRRTEVRRLEDWNRGGFVSTDGSVQDGTAHIAKRRPAPHWDLEDIEAARQRVHQQRIIEAKKIQLEQLVKGAQREAQQLRQRADDLERETSERFERLLRGETEIDEGEGEEPETTAVEDGDQSDVRSNWSYAPTEVYSNEGDHPRRASPSPPLPSPISPSTPTHPREERSQTPTPASPQVAGASSLLLEPQGQLAQGPLHRQHTRLLTPPRADEFVVVTRQVVDRLDDLTGSYVRRTKHYRVRQTDLESLYGNSGMEEV